MEIRVRQTGLLSLRPSCVEWWLVYGRHDPRLTAKELLELVRASGDRADYPDNIYGYGVPDMWKAYNSYKVKNEVRTGTLHTYT